MAFFLVLLSLSFASAEEYDAMKGVNSVKVMFDMRDGIPASAAVHLKLIHDTYQELSVMKKEPVFVVVFMGGGQVNLQQPNCIEHRKRKTSHGDRRYHLANVQGRHSS